MFSSNGMRAFRTSSYIDTRCGRDQYRSPNGDKHIHTNRFTHIRFSDPRRDDNASSTAVGLLYADRRVPFSFR